MTRLLLRAAALTAAIPLAGASAQEVRVYSGDPGRIEIVRGVMTNRAMLGITLADRSERADTLGLRVDVVNEDSPAAKAGLKVGDRLQSINGVSLRADRSDAGERDYDGVLSRRLQREMAKVSAGDTVNLRVLSDGRARDVRVPTESPQAMAGRLTRTMTRSATADRPVLGISIGTTGSLRDTLGVFVSAVNDEGPAAKAGIVEGDRIAAINGVSLRTAREDVRDPQVTMAKTDRLRAEMAKVDAGQSVELTVITAGRSRTVRVTPVKSSDLPGSAGAVWGFEFPAAPLPPAAPSAPARVVVPARPASPPAPPAPVRGTVIRDVRVL
jgi:serine protease Do